MNQEIALSVLKTGVNVYLTGSAGSGKTYLLNTYIEYLRQREVPVAVTASTGIAATHIGGQTIHSWSGIGIRDKITPQDLEKIGKNKNTVKRIKETRVLIIDEISMLSGQVLTGIDLILQHFRRTQEPFGGIQVIVTGDFFQLPPVSREPMTNREKFAFMAPVWVQAAFRICYLTDQFRQGRDMLSIVLSEIRSQDVSDDSLERIQEKLIADESAGSAIRLYTHNADVDAMNQRQLKANPHPLKTFYAESKGKSQLLESLKQSVLAGPVLELKKEAKVMFVRNNNEKGYFNGTVGTVIGFDEEDDYPVVQLDNDRIITARPEEWTVVDENENILASYKQIPLRLAWAITVHKSQGMTLMQAEIDLSKTFEAGQGYVALSRLKSWEGLILSGINRVSLAVDPLALKADARFKELSEESEDWINEWSDEERSRAEMDYILRCGGTVDPDKISINSVRTKVYVEDEKKENTYQVTKKLLLAGRPLDEIALERDLSLGTIIGHIERLKMEEHDLDISKYRPDQKTIDKVARVIQKIKEQSIEEYMDKSGNVRLQAIFKAVNGQLDYETIRLTRLFVT